MTSRLPDDLRRSKHLLIASRDERLVRISADFYRLRGFEVTGAGSTGEILAVMKTTRPQVVLLSTDMGRQNIPDVINNIKAIDQDCNVLLFAREEDSESIKSAWRSGAFFFLRQGATPTEIIPEVNRAFRDYFERAEYRYWQQFVFVLMPFSHEFDDTYELGIKAAADTCGLVCERVDEQHFTNSILEQIFSNIHRARFIIADVTGNNPNVFFEAGYAYALEKPIIFVKKDSEDIIPFDLQHSPHIVYEGKITFLRDQLIQRLQGLLEKGIGRKQ